MGHGSHIRVNSYSMYGRQTLGNLVDHDREDVVDEADFSKHAKGSFCSHS